MVSGISVFFGILCVVLFGGFIVCVAWYCGETSGRKSSDREVTRRVLLSDTLDDDCKVEILSIITDRIYWKDYEEAD